MSSHDSDDPTLGTNPIPPNQEPALSDDAPDLFHSYTRGVCPECQPASPRLVDGTRLIRDGKVFARRHCPEHGTHEALVSGDAAWFEAAWGYTKPGEVPLQRSTEPALGCPLDCGLCSEHEQHTCLPIIEVTDHCNMDCPICLVENRGTFFMSPEAFGAVIDGLVANEGQIETVNLSGGEPTVHPELLALVDLARRPEIARVSISTNGVALAASPALCDELAARGVYVNLQLDALDADVLRALRGDGDHVTVKRRALDNLEAAGARITLIMTVTRGVNDHLIGEALRIALARDSVLSVLFQPAAYIGQGGATFPHDPLDRITVPDVVRLLEEQTDGMLRRDDFHPLPCSHPLCFGLTYLLRVPEAEPERATEPGANTGWVPFPRFVPLDRYIDLISNRGTIRPDRELEDAMLDAIDDLWSGADQAPDNEKLLRALKRALRALYPETRALAIEERLRIGEGLVKTVFIHAFMDAHTFEVDRVRKCCTHYALPDGRLMPVCTYNLFHRRCEPRPSSLAAQGGKRDDQAGDAA